MKHREFLFEFTPQQILLLTQMRAERMDRVKEDGGKPASSERKGAGISPGDMRILGASGIFGG